MSGLVITHADWLNANAYRRFPLVDAASAGVSDGLIVDVVLPIPVGLLVPDRLFLHSVIGFAQGVVISLASIDNPNDVLASATVFVAQHQLNKSYPLVGAGVLAGCMGRINIGTLEAVNEAAAQALDFSREPETARLTPSVVRPALQGITAVSVVSGGVVIGTITGGPVILKAGQNVSLAVDETTRTITINSSLVSSGGATTGDSSCGCDTAEPERPAVRSINGVLPDNEGDIKIVGSTNLTITKSDNGLSIDDETTTPCCECDQVDTLYAALQAVEKESAQLFAAVEQQRARLDNLAAVLAASALTPPAT